MKYSEETLQFWTTPLSKTEEERVDNTINMIKGAIKGYDKLNSLSIECSRRDHMQIIRMLDRIVMWIFV